jgi:hypothetical protein
MGNMTSTRNHSSDTLCSAIDVFNIATPGDVEKLHSLPDPDEALLARNIEGDTLLHT